MKTRTLSLLLAAFVSFGVLVPATAADKKGSVRTGEQGLQKTTGSPVVTYMDINQISTVLRSNGTADIDQSQTNSGFVFPKGSSKTAFFQSGLLWGARVAGDPQVRVGGSAYTSGLQPGKLLSPGVAEDPNLPKNRIYRVRKDWRVADLGSEINDERKPAAEIRAQYQLDWNEWPATDGAPFTDVDSNGVYDPTVDIPGVPGADQTVWFVANDNNVTNVANLYGARPLGVECQFTVWGYAQEGALGSMIFKRYLLINKSNITFDSMYVCQWADPDLGNADDDLAGCDTSLSLGYIYNSNNTDATYNPLPPPAAGFDFFQGPLVPSPGSTGISRGRSYEGYRNLPMTAFFYFINSDATLADPTRADPAGSTQFYNFMRGRVGLTGQFFEDPQGNPTTFTLTGDPKAGTGWIDGRQFPAADRRIGLSSGPFTMAAGDTQEIVVAEIAAGALPGVDRLTAVELLKFFDKSAQLAYDNGFRLPVPPPAPLVKATEQDREIILDWGSNFASAQATETSDNRGFKFQGYNVYQLPFASAPATQGRKIAVYDVADDGVTRITDQIFDPSIGVVSSKVVQLGTDSGIKRFISIKTDVFNGSAPLINGIRYYFAVTAYSYNPDPNVVPNNLENPVATMTVVPHASNPGIRTHSSSGDTITVAHVSGSSDATLPVEIVNPAKVTGHDYEIQVVVADSVTVDFEGEPLRFANPLWQLMDKTTGKVVLPLSTVYVSNTSDRIADSSIQVGISASPFWTPGQEIAAQTYVPENHFNWAGVDAGSAFFGGGLDLAYNFTASALRPFEVTQDVEVRFDSANGQGAYNFRRTLTGGSASAPYAGFYPQPFKVYNVTDPAHPRQIDFVFMEKDEQPTQNNIWAPGPVSDNREYFYFIDDAYTSTAKPEYASTTLGDLLSVKPALYAGWYTLNDTTGPAYRNGDVWRIRATKIVTGQDRWTFSTAGRNMTSSLDIAKQDIQQVNVFPNPYYGVNTEEINKYQRFVTFSHLPKRATIKVFNLAGVMIRQIDKNSDSQFERWDLANDSGLPVGSGLYIAHITMPDLDGMTKILKLAIVQEQQILDRF